MAHTPKLEYTGTWIPAEIMLDNELKPIAKLVYATVASFQKFTGSNAWLAERVGISERSVRDQLQALREKGYITEISFDGRKRCLAARQNLPVSGAEFAYKNKDKSKEENPTGSSAGASAPAPATPSDSILAEPPQKVPRKRGSMICAFHSKYGQPGANCRACGTNQRTVNETADLGLVKTKTSAEPPTTNALHYRVIKKYGLPVSNHLHVKAKSKAFDAEIGSEAAQAYLQRLLDVDYTGIPGDFKPELNHSRDIYDKRIKITAFLDQHAPIQKRSFDSVAWGKQQEERARKRRVELGFEEPVNANN